MRILPDKNFKESYNKHYVENYKKLTARRKELGHKLKNVTFDSIKATIIGAFICIVLFIVFIIIGSWSASDYNEKNQQIAELQAEVDKSISDIRLYQIIDSKEKFKQIDEALSHVVSLQNQYVKNEFSDTFDAYSTYYLGEFNNNWASDENLVNPEWRGFLDTSCDFRDNADMLLILSDDNRPVLVVTVSFDIDENGNLGAMTAVNKMRLV